MLPLLPKAEEPDNAETPSSRAGSERLDLGECPVSSFIAIFITFKRNSSPGLFGAIFKDQSSIHVCTRTLCLW